MCLPCCYDLPYGIKRCEHRVRGVKDSDRYVQYVIVRTTCTFGEKQRKQREAVLVFLEGIERFPPRIMVAQPLQYVPGVPMFGKRRPHL
jgi:hypothetical protein